MSRRAQPLVSVVIPAWNAEATLSETLESVSAQTYPNLEIIIVDDGSTDRTAQIAEEFCSREPRARLVRKANGGLASARNRGIEESRGEWIAPIDADDLWHPTRIEKMVTAALAAKRTPGFVYCWFRHIDRDGAVAGSGPRWRIEGPAFNRLAYLNVVGNGSGLLLSREAIVEAGGYDSSLRAEEAQGAEDMLVQDRIARGHPIAVVPEYLVGWRQTGENMSGDAEQMDRSCRLVYERLRRDGTPAPHRSEQWMIASSAFNVAEHYGASGRLGACLSWLARSLWLDPLRSGLTLGYRLTRSVRRRLGAAPAAHRARQNFLDADPTDSTMTDPYEIGWFKRLLERMDERRLKRLAMDDTQPGSARSARPS